jgi:hypothetical protein
MYQLVDKIDLLRAATTSGGVSIEIAARKMGLTQ